MTEFVVAQRTAAPASLFNVDFAPAPAHISGPAPAPMPRKNVADDPNPGNYKIDTKLKVSMSCDQIFAPVLTSRHRNGVSNVYTCLSGPAARPICGRHISTQAAGPTTPPKSSRIIRLGPRLFVSSGPQHLKVNSFGIHTGRHGSTTRFQQTHRSTTRSKRFMCACIVLNRWVLYPLHFNDRRPRRCLGASKLDSIIITPIRSNRHISN
jgi:hypothetical protein